MRELEKIAKNSLIKGFSKEDIIEITELREEK